MKLNCAGQKISVIGAGRSGIASAIALAQRGAEVLLSDGKSTSSLSVDILEEIKNQGLRFVAQASPIEAIPSGTELVVTSPGVPRSAAVLQEAIGRSIPIWSEIELAYRISPAPIVAITGTNGKTTTTLLTVTVLNSTGKNAVAAGNISADELKKTLVEAAIEAEHDADPNRVLVAEISSFQLEWVHTFKPWIACLTNITPDHLNRHGSMVEYAAAKAQIFAAQNSSDWAIWNSDDPVSRDLMLHGDLIRDAQPIAISRNAPADLALPYGCVIDDTLRISLDTKHILDVMPVSQLPDTLPGEHSIFNALMASSIGAIAGAEACQIADGIRSFAGVPHRMEFVAELNGVRYINNSMCTNISAACASLEAVGAPAIVIMGGADKELDFTPIGPALCRIARHVVLIGSAAPKIDAAIRGAGYSSISYAGTMEQAVEVATEHATYGDTVILSPACASFDMFRDFEHRGAAFRQAVRNTVHP